MSAFPLFLFASFYPPLQCSILKGFYAHTPFEIIDLIYDLIVTCLPAAVSVNCTKELTARDLPCREAVMS